MRFSRNRRADPIVIEGIQPALPIPSDNPALDAFKVALTAFDWTKAKQKDFLKLVTLFESAATADNPVLVPLPKTAGIVTITPEQAMTYLFRNRPGANRKIDWSTVQSYARHIDSRHWVVTGEAVIFTVLGVLLDGQHRLWACVVSGKPFTTYYIPDIPDHPQLFAYVDAGRPRNGRATLQTAGFDKEAAAVMGGVLLAAEAIEQGKWTWQRKGSLRAANYELLQYAMKFPNAEAAAQAVLGPWRKISEWLGKRRVAVGLFGMSIMDNGGDIDDVSAFFEAVLDLDATATPQPIIELRAEIAKAGVRGKAVWPQDNQILMLLVAVFNAWNNEAPLGADWLSALQSASGIPPLVLTDSAEAA